MLEWKYSVVAIVILCFKDEIPVSGYRARRLMKNTDGLPENVDLLQHLHRIVRVDEVSIQDGKKPRPVTLVLYVWLFYSEDFPRYLVIQKKLIIFSFRSNTMLLVYSVSKAGLFSKKHRWTYEGHVPITGSSAFDGASVDYRTFLFITVP